MIKVGVVGTGTVGILAISHMLGYLNSSFKVVSIHDPSIKIVGVGESAQPGVLSTLHRGANFKITEDADELDATLKFGGSWVDWREDPFTMTLLPPNIAMHFNNFKLKEFCFKRFKEIWKDKFEVIEGRVSDIRNADGKYAIVNVDDEIHIFDYVIDCRGFPKDFSGYTVVDTIPVNHCLVYNESKPGDWNLTINKAVKHGWMFEIPLQTRNASGYLYNDKITTKREVIDDLSSIVGVPVDELKFNEFSFKNYRANSYFDGRVMLNGNSAVFYEPIEAMSTYMYEIINRNFFDYINIPDNKISSNPYMVTNINRNVSRLTHETEMFINFLYHGGSTHDSEFWRVTKERSTKFLSESQMWIEAREKIIDHVKNKKFTEKVCSWDVSHWLEWDRNLGYNYFNVD